MIRTEGPCYELVTVPVSLYNPFPEDGTFKVVLVETQDAQMSNPLGVRKKKKPKKIRCVLDFLQFLVYTQNTARSLQNCARFSPILNQMNALL